MIDALLRTSLARRGVVLFLVAVVAAVGIWSYQRLPIDAVPDITNVQVQINTEAAGYSPLEVEQRITYPVEVAIAGIPHLEYTRSLSRYGLSQVTVAFEDGTDIYFARNLVNERLQQARGQLPADIEPDLGPIATGLGEVFLYTVHAAESARQPDGRPYDAAALRTAYEFCERTRNRLYLLGRDGDSLPQDAPAVTRLARSLGTTATGLRNDYRRVTRRARAVAGCSPSACPLPMWSPPSRGTTPTSAPATSSATASNT